MVHAQAHLDGAVITEQEISEGRLHTSGPDVGTFYVSGPHVSWDDAARDPETGKILDFGPSYVRALQALIDQDERIRQGHAYKITIV